MASDLLLSGDYVEGGQTLEEQEGESSEEARPAFDEPELGQNDSTHRPLWMRRNV